MKKNYTSNFIYVLNIIRIYAIGNEFVKDKINIINYKKFKINKANALILL